MRNFVKTIAAARSRTGASTVHLKYTMEKRVLLSARTAVQKQSWDEVVAQPGGAAARDEEGLHARGDLARACACCGAWGKAAENCSRGSEECVATSVSTCPKGSNMLPGTQIACRFPCPRCAPPQRARRTARAPPAASSPRGPAQHCWRGDRFVEKSSEFTENFMGQTEVDTLWVQIHRPQA